MKTSLAAVRSRGTAMSRLPTDKHRNSQPNAGTPDPERLHREWLEGRR